MRRRHFLALFAGVLGLGAAAVYHFNLLRLFKYWPDNNRIFNRCFDSELPPELAHHDLILSAQEGIDMRQMWDGHVHLLGMGDTDSGIVMNPDFFNLLKLNHYVRFRFFFNAACPTPGLSVDEGFLARLKSLQWAQGLRFVLLAFDYTYNEQGERLPEQTPFYIPNEYAARIRRQSPDTFEWLASVHPYRPDCVEALEQAVRDGARGVKWLPPAMGIDPASERCDRFYQAMAYWDIPLLCHCGDENAVHGTDVPAYGNPLRLRRALDQGVKVVIAHCGSLGHNRDIDKGPQGPYVNNFDLFTRLMDEPRYEGLLFGDLSAITQVNRVYALKTLIIRRDWQARLLYGSDYPLPGIIPVISLKFLQEKQYITPEQAEVLTQVREYNPLLFDFVLKRHLQADGQQFDSSVFHTRSLWTGVRTEQQMSGLMSAI
jgi:uncharacterized protein